MNFNRNYLNTDNNRMERNLRFVNNDLERNLNQYFGGSGGSGTNMGAPPRDYQVVQPKPGFCIKTFKVNTNEKYFINVCQTEEIPAPEDISDTELSDILNSDEQCSFRIPMSISEPRTTKDKSNSPVDAVDIAINPKFLTKIEKSILFRNFFLALIGEAISDKYNVQIKIDKAIILNNRKFIGNLVTHRVRNSDVKTVLNSYQNPSKQDLEKLHTLERSGKTANSKLLVQEIDETEVKSLKQKSQILKQQKHLTRAQENNVPLHKLRAYLRGNCVEKLQAELFLPKCISSQEISLDIGEDRILMESPKHGYLFDKFVNYNLKQEGARAIFNKTNKMLLIRIPVLSVE